MAGGDAGAPVAPEVMRCPVWAVNSDATLRCNRPRAHHGQHLDGTLGVWWAIAGAAPEGAEHGIG